MGWLYERKETKDKTIVIFKYQAIWYYLLIVALITAGIEKIRWAVLGIFIIITLINIFGKIKINKEIKKAMKTGKVKVSGNKFSIKNPLTFEISKH